jgi:thermostable 8-oxoguanine DNA glycosylase
MIRTAHKQKHKLNGYLKLYRHQPVLTAHLDKLPNEPLTDQTVNEIVLWKVNRYVRLTSDVRKSLYALRTLRPKEHRKAEQVLIKLLCCSGVDLAMASTFLRFQNAKAFQIIDRHAYRSLMGKPYVLHSKTPIAIKVSTYFSYLDTLHDFAKGSSAAFRDLDRILYMFDKKHNGTL